MATYSINSYFSTSGDAATTIADKSPTITKSKAVAEPGSAERKTMIKRRHEMQARKRAKKRLEKMQAEVARKAIADKKKAKRDDAKRKKQEIERKKREERERIAAIAKKKKIEAKRKAAAQKRHAKRTKMAKGGSTSNKSKLEQWDIIIKSDSAYQMLDQKYKALKAKRGKIRAAPVDPRTTTKYPIEDTEVDGSYKIDLGRGRTLMEIEGSEEINFGEVAHVWDFLTLFHKTLALEPFALDDFQKALLDSTRNLSLVAEVHMALLRVLLNDELDDEQLQRVNEATATRVDRVIRGTVHASMVTALSWPEVLRVFAKRQLPLLCPPLTGCESALQHLEKVEYRMMSVQSKLALLRWLVAACNRTTTVGNILRTRIKQRKELIETKRVEDYAKLKSKRETAKAERLAAKAKRDAIRIAKETAKQAEKDAEEAIEAGGSVPVTVTPVPKPVTKKEQDNVHEKDKGVEIIADLQIPADVSEDSEQEADDHPFFIELPRKVKMQRRKEQAERRQNRKMRAVEHERAVGQKERQDALMQKIERAIAANDIHALKAAMDKGKSVGLEGGTRRKVWRTVRFAEAFKDLRRLEAEEEVRAIEEAKRLQVELAEQKHQNDLEQLSLGTEPLGWDRKFRRYWKFRADERIFQESGDKLAECRSDGADKQKPKTQWRFFSSLKDIKALANSIGEKGIREFALKKKLYKILQEMGADTEDSQPVEKLEWLSEGHKWIGARVRRVFLGVAAGNGTITGWLPAVLEGEKMVDSALWHVVHDDGDEEDLEEEEVEEAICNFTQKVDDPTLPFIKYVNKQNKIDRIQKGQKIGVDMVVDSLRKVETQIAPELRKRGSNWSSRAGGRHHFISALKGDAITSSQIRDALRVCYIHVKRKHKYHHSSKQGLENAVHELQEEPDQVLEEHWVDEGHEFLGKNARRFFQGSKQDGKITQWLPPRGSEQALWHMQHQDGDEEDLEEAEAAQAIKYFAEGVEEEPVQLMPQREWTESGPKVGQKVRRFFVQQQRVDGVVTGYSKTGPEGDDRELWRVQHTDGDQEDVDAWELKMAIKDFNQATEKDGWITLGHKLLGVRVRRFFDGGRVTSDGVIKGFAEATDEDELLFHMVHDDGDEEDLELYEVRKAIQDKNTVVQKEEEVEFNSTLWPCVESRDGWLVHDKKHTLAQDAFNTQAHKRTTSRESVSDANLAQMALCLLSLRHHCIAFGVLDFPGKSRRRKASGLTPRDMAAIWDGDTKSAMGRGTTGHKGKRKRATQVASRLKKRSKSSNYTIPGSKASRK